VSQSLTAVGFELSSNWGDLLVVHRLDRFYRHGDLGHRLFSRAIISMMDGYYGFGFAGAGLIATPRRRRIGHRPAVLLG